MNKDYRKIYDIDMKKLKNFALIILCLGAITMLGACNMKVSSEKTVSRADQIAYLKAHEQEMTDILKRNHPKIETIQWQWDTVKVEVTGNGTPQGAGTVLTIEGRFNQIQDSSFLVGFESEDKTDYPSMSNMTLLQNLTIDGGSKPYE